MAGTLGLGIQMFLLLKINFQILKFQIPILWNKKIKDKKSTKIEKGFSRSLGIAQPDTG